MAIVALAIAMMIWVTVDEFRGLRTAVPEQSPSSDYSWGGIVLIGVIALIYFFPTMLASEHHNRRAVFALNLLLGWTIVGWFAALIWSQTKLPPAATSQASSTYACPKCGAPMTSGARFCGACGVKVSVVAEEK